MSIEKLTPHNIEAEQSFLGSLLLDKDAMVKVADQLTPEDFYLDKHRRVYEAMLDLYRRSMPIDLLSLGNRLTDKNELEMLCKHSSDMERMAAEAERASIKFKQVEFMSDKVGQSFKGTITGVTEWGIYVEINENKCEGMIRMRDMRDDNYYFEAESYRYVGRNKGIIYALGDTVWVEVKKADVIRKQLDYAFVSDPESGEKMRSDEGNETS